MANIKAQQRNDITSIRRSLHRNSDLAVLGQTSDANSAVFVNDRPGYWWVRFVQAGGTFGPAVQVRGCTIPMVTNPGVPVKMGIVEGEKAVLGPDFVGLLAQGVNPTQSAVVDPNANNPSFVNQAYITTAYANIIEGTLTVGLRRWLPQQSDTIYNVGGTPDWIADFTGHVPSAGNHCVAVIAVLPDFSALEWTYSTAKDDGIPLDLDDVQEAISAGTSGATRLWAFSLADAQTVLTEANRFMDLRNPWNIENSTDADFYQTVQGNGTPATQQPILDFENGTNTTVTVTNDGPGTRTKVKYDVTGITSGINQLTGDVTAGPGTGSQAATLAIVNSNVGTFSRVKSVTANAKGLITSITQGLVDLASEVTGLLGKSNGGTGVDLSATGGTTQVLAQDASHVISARNLVAADIPNLDASKITSGQLALARGGTHADLSATGGANQFVKQSSSGADLSVGTIASADIATALTTPGPIGGTTPNDVTAKTLLLKGQTTLTISSNTVAVTQSYHKLTSPSPTDTLNTATGGTTGQFLLLIGTGGKSITITHQAGGTGQFVLFGGVNFILASSTVFMLFEYDGTNWIQIAGTVVPGETVSVGTVAAARLGTMTGDSGSGGASGAVPAPAAGDAVHAFFGDGAYAGSGRKLVDYTTLGADAANIDLTSISGSYKELELWLFLRSDRAGQTSDNAVLRFNNDSTVTNYYSDGVAIALATPSGLERLGATSGGLEVFLGATAATASSNEFGVLRVSIFGYQNTANNRVAFWSGFTRRGTTTGLVNPTLGGGSWLNTAAAISRITIIPANGANWKAGSSYMLYGLS